MLKLRKGDVHYETLLHRLREIIQGIESGQAGRISLGRCLLILKTVATASKSNTIFERLLITDKSLGRDKLFPTSGVQPKSLPNKYHVPFSIQGLLVTKNFINRPAEMQSLEKVLLPKSNINRREIFVLRGLGGIGKTQLTIEFIRRHYTKFSAVFWLDGSSEDSLKRSLARYAGRIASDQIPGASKIYAQCGEGDVNAVVQEVLDWLATVGNDTWLLVFDNVDRELDSSKSDPLAYDIEQYLPDADHGSILITTRLAQMEQLGESQEVKKVNSDTAQEILKSWYKRAYGKDASSMKLPCCAHPLIFSR